MKLAIIRQRYTPYGGAERFLSLALQALAKEKVALTLFTRVWPKEDQSFQTIVCNPFYVGNLWRDWRFAHAIGKRLGRMQFDLVQSHERIAGCELYRAGDGVHRVWLTERLRGQSLWRRLTVLANPYHRYVLNAERRMFESDKLKAVICNSAMVRDEIRSHFSIAPEKLQLIYNAVDCQVFHPGLRAEREALRERYNIPQAAVLFLLLGSGYVRKGVEQTMVALATLRSAAHLLIVGRDKRMDRYASLARDYGINDRIHFAGAQSDPKPYYGAADVFVLPTLYDPLPNAVLEAMACGLPIITSNKCGAAELVKAHRAGLICSARDVATLTHYMKILLSPEARQEMGERARQAVLPLTMESMTERLLDLYRSLLGYRSV